MEEGGASLSKRVVQFDESVGVFATPIAYPSSLLRQPWRSVFALNPMVGVVDGFRHGRVPARRSRS